MQVIRSLILLAIVWPSASEGDRVEAGLNRWAIVSDPQVQESGLADVVLAEVSGIDGIELVERDQIARVTHELVLSKMLGPEDVEARLKLGRLVRADGLILLTLTRRENKEYIKVVLSECAHGARLRIDHLPWSQEQAAETAGEIRTMVVETRLHYAHGIKNIVGVSPLVSRTLVHDYDYLQAGLAYVIQNAIASYPGIAVIEVEEAQTIRRERELAAGSQTERVVPFLLEGEYRVVHDSNRQNPELSLQIRIHDGHRTVHTFQQEGLSFEETAKLLRDDCSRWARTLTGQVSNQGLSVDDQIEFMACQADHFAQLGSYEHSVGLREACILLKPDMVEQRVALVREYDELFSRPFQPRNGHPEEPRELEAILQTRLGHWRLCLSHLEYLIRRYPSMPETAARLCHEIYAAMVKWGVKGGYAPEYPPELLPLLDQMDALKEEFLVQVTPLLLPRINMEDWHRILVEWSSWTYGRSRSPQARTEYEVMARMFIDVIPADHPITPPLAEYIYDEARRPYPPDADDLRTFLERLYTSGIPRNVYLARLGVLRSACTLLERYKRGSPEEMETLLAAIEELLEEAREAEIDPLVRCANDMKKALTRRMAKLQAYTRRQTTVPRKTKPRPAQKKELDRLDGIPATVVPVPLQLRHKSGKMEPIVNKTWRSPYITGFLEPLKLVRCDRQLDVFWDENVLLFHYTPGVLDEILVVSDRSIEDVAWDGRHVWVAIRGEGIRLYEPSGKLWATIGHEQRLPPCDVGIKLYAMDQGEALVVGSFGEHHRAWCARVRWENGEVDTRVFHEATTLLGGKRALELDYDGLQEKIKAANDDSTVVFSPWKIAPLPPALPSGKRLVLVGRYFAYGRNSYHRLKPLRIDLDELSVEIEKSKSTALSDAAFGQRYLLDNGTLFRHVGTEVHYCPVAQALEAHHRIKWTKLCRTWEHRFHVFEPMLIPYQGCIYAPGEVWYRIHPQTLQVERLGWRFPEGAAGGRVRLMFSGRWEPHGSRQQRFNLPLRAGLSAHYGLIVWSNTQECFRIDVAEPAPKTLADRAAQPDQQASSAERSSKGWKSQRAEWYRFRDRRKMMSWMIDLGFAVALAGVPAIGALLFWTGLRRGGVRSLRKCPQCGQRRAKRALKQCAECGHPLTEPRRRPARILVGSLCLASAAAIPYLSSSFMIWREGGFRRLSGSDAVQTRPMAELLATLHEEPGRYDIIEEVMRRIRSGQSSHEDDRAMNTALLRYLEVGPVIRSSWQSALDICMARLRQGGWTEQEARRWARAICPAKIAYDPTLRTILIRPQSRPLESTAASGVICKWTIDVQAVDGGPFDGGRIEYLTLDRWVGRCEPAKLTVSADQCIVVSVTLTCYDLGADFPRQRFVSSSEDQKARMIEDIWKQPPREPLLALTEERTLQPSEHLQTILGTCYWPAIPVFEKEADNGVERACRSKDAPFPGTLPMNRAMNGPEGV